LRKISLKKIERGIKIHNFAPVSKRRITLVISNGKHFVSQKNRFLGTWTNFKAKYVYVRQFFVLLETRCTGMHLFGSSAKLPICLDPSPTFQNNFFVNSY